MKKLIITADDYGMSKGVNEAIEQGIAAGLITSTNVMTNMEYFRDAKKLRKTGASVGLHWTVSAGKPVCDPQTIPTLVDESGTFYPYPEFRSRFRKGLISKYDLKKELKAQYESFIEVCGAPDYWNTHQNTCVDFGAFKLFVDTAKELNIFKMRSYMRVYIAAAEGKSTRSLQWRLVEPAKRMLLKSWLKYAKQNGMSFPYGVILALCKDDIKKPEYYFSKIRIAENTIAEYVIHPSTALDSEFFGNIADNRILEYKQFTSEALKQILNKNEFTLVNFDSI